MARISEWVHEAGGLLHKRDLVVRGATDRDLTRAVRDRDVARVRRGWYSTWAPSDPRFRAVRVGGRLTGLAALRLDGAPMWDVRPPPVVSVPRGASRLRRQKGVRVVYESPRVARRGSTSVVDPRDALLRVILDESHEAAVIVWDWALRSDLFTQEALAEVQAAVPINRQGFFAWTDGRSESILESAARVRALRDGHEVATQVPLPGHERIDLVIDGTIALELDGREYHESTFVKDRTKDLAIAREGWMPLRADYSMVRSAWTTIAHSVDVGLGQHAPRRHEQHVAERTMRHPPRVTVYRGRRRRTWRCRAPVVSPG